MKQTSAIVCTLCLLGLAGILPTPTARAQSAAGWLTLLDGSNLGAFTPLGDANWRAVDGAVQADGGSGFLMSNVAYGDFDLRVEFWASPDANSGVFIRCEDLREVSSMSCYEVNIWDQRPDQTYRTGGIVNVAEPTARIDAGDQWNTYEITARGPRLTVRLNGTQTADATDEQHARGPFALQYSAGTMKFRNVQIREIE